MYLGIFAIAAVSLGGLVCLSMVRHFWTAVPFTLHDRTLNFFSGAPGGVRVVAGDREYIYSLTLPEMWDSKWTPPAEAHTGIPRFSQVFEGASDLWPWLAILGAIGLLVEWLAYGRFRRGMGRARLVPLREKEVAAEVTR